MFTILKEIFWTMPIDMIAGSGRFSILGLILALFIWVLEALAVFLIAFGIFYLADTAYIQEHPEQAAVISKEHTAAHTTYIPTKVGQVTVMNPIYHPDSWSMTFHVNSDGSYVSFDISHEQFLTLRKGDEVTIMIRKGRLSGSKYGFGFTPNP